TAEYLEKYAPFGSQNRQPIFAIKDATCVSTKLVGKQANHRKYVFDLGGLTVSGMSWYQPAAMATPNQTKLIIIASLGIEEWREKALLLSVKQIND
ncbi:hypothetical protein KA012_02570, partial [Candidatus Woesebacteria bacterium]|nr:hypothetical protein [Candidatus Woesebacteria bacterium]